MDMTPQTRMAAALNSTEGEAVLFKAAALETLWVGVRTDYLLMDRVLLFPNQTVRAVAAAVAGSVLAGGLLFLAGLILGMGGLLSFLAAQGLADFLAAVQLGLHAYAPLLVVAAGVATVPFALLLIISGFLGVAPLWLLPAAIVARGLRYGLLGWLTWKSGMAYRDWLNRSFHGLTMVVALGLLLLSVFMILMVYA
jgi:hypothetical protein